MPPSPPGLLATPPQNKMADWQYTYPTRPPVLKANEGYAVKLKGRIGAGSGRYTALLTYGENNLYVWAHDISFDFQIAGSYAQSAHFREFYPHHMVQPRVRLVGQCANEWQYGNVAEWVRRSHSYVLRSRTDTGRKNLVRLTIPEGGDPRLGKKHISHDFSGHVLAIQRQHERFVNAPEFTLEFVIVLSRGGLVDLGLGDPSNNTVSHYQQITNNIRYRHGAKSGEVTVHGDPDEFTADPVYGTTQSDGPGHPNEGAQSRPASEPNTGVDAQMPTGSPPYLTTGETRNVETATQWGTWGRTDDGEYSYFNKFNSVRYVWDPKAKKWSK